jgi:hypothetical protein
LMHAAGLDASAFGFTQVPAGATVDFSLEFTSHEVYSQVNAPFEPATVPEGLAG